MANPEHLKILKQGVDVWNRWREDNPDTLRPDLSSVRLPGSNFQNADFAGTDLKNAYLLGVQAQDARLMGAELRSAQLGNAQFQKASFAEADLTQAHLTGSDLSGGSLWGANLNNAVLTGANLALVVFGGTTIVNTDLSQTCGLEKVVHLGRCNVDVDTLYRSQGRIPERFLRGCGVPEEFIDTTRGLFGKLLRFLSCFISYSHADKTFARRLHDQLQAQGIRCWLDEHDLKPGDRILDLVNDAIRLHDKILLCCSETSLESWWVKDEIRKAQERERREGRDIIIPLMVDRYLLEGWEDGLAADLRSRLAADFTGWEHDNAKFEREFERVMKALRTDEGARGGATVSEA